MTSKKIVVAGFVLACLVGSVAVFMMAGGKKPDALRPQPNAAASGSVSITRGKGHPVNERRAMSGRDASGALQSQEDETSSANGASASDETLSKAEKHDVEEENLVDAFDKLTDAWVKPSEKRVTMTDIDKFKRAFSEIPKSRQDECIHRALNLIPDKNIMLLAGILMDKTMNRGIVKTVYDDIINREENVKKPILQEIFKDKTHPCWSDTAWILEVTGEIKK